MPQATHINIRLFTDFSQTNSYLSLSSYYHTQELAIKLNIVRQTVSKWENGLSVPDSDMLITLADELDTSVSVLLGETVMEPMTDDLKESLKN